MTAPGTAGDSLSRCSTTADSGLPNGLDEVAFLNLPLQQHSVAADENRNPQPIGLLKVRSRVDIDQPAFGGMHSNKVLDPLTKVASSTGIERE